MLLTCLITPFTAKQQSRLMAFADDFDTVYYFSDNPSSATICGLLTENNIIDHVVRYYYATAGEFKTNITNMYNSTIFDNYENKYIIFEVTNYAYFDPNYWDDFTDLLEDIFSIMQTNGCKIMFICGVDEMIWQPRNDFLSYVDIHINTDREFGFFSNFINIIAINGDNGRINNCTIIADSNISEGITNGYNDSNFFKYHLMRMIRCAYYDDISEATNPLSSSVMHDILINNNIKIICQLENGLYYDAVDFQTIGTWNNSNLNEFYNDYIANQYVYAISDNSGKTAAQAGEWIGFMMSACVSLSNPFSIFINNQTGYYFNQYAQPNVFLSPTGNNQIYSIIVGFLQDNDLNPFHNWLTGGCAVTYKDVQMGPGGWMIDLTGSSIGSLIFSDFYGNMFLTPEDPDYDYYYDYDDKYGVA